VSPDVEVGVPTLETSLDAATPGAGRAAAQTMIFRGLALPLSFGTSVVTSRFLLPAGRGAFVLGLLTVSLASTLFGNVGLAVVHEIGQRRHDTRSLVTLGLGVSLALGIAAAAVLLPIDLVLANQGYRVIALAALALPAMLLTQAISGALTGLGRIQLWNLLQFALPLLTIAGMLVFVVALSKGVTGAVFSWAIAQVLVAAAALAAAHDLWWPLRVRGLPLARLKPILKLGLKVGAVNVVSLFNYRIELLVLEAYRGLHGVGVYSLATSLGELLWLGSSALATAVTVRAVASAEHQAAQAIAQATRHAVLVTLAGGVVLGITSIFLVSVVFGQQFRGAVAPLLVLIPGVILFSPGSVLAVYFSVRRGQTRYPLAVAGLSLVVTGVLAVLLIPRLGLIGAALATTIGYGVSIGVAVFAFVRLSKLPARSLIPTPADLHAYRSMALGLLGR
jgi:O-antigen/teichoic acid export membrane protein